MTDLDPLGQLDVDPASYVREARLRAREVAERDIARRLARKQAERRRGNRP